MIIKQIISSKAGHGGGEYKLKERVKEREGDKQTKKIQSATFAVTVADPKHRVYDCMQKGRWGRISATFVFYYHIITTIHANSTWWLRAPTAFFTFLCVSLRLSLPCHSVFAHRLLPLSAFTGFGSRLFDCRELFCKYKTNSPSRDQYRALGFNCLCVEVSLLLRNCHYFSVATHTI